MKNIATLLVACLLAGCVGTSAKLNKVSIGMSKQEVIQAIGTPDSVSAQGGTEFLVYYWASPKQVFGDENNLPEFFIRLVDGKVDAYGKKGDFDSTKPRQQDLNIKLDQKIDMK